MVAEVLCGSDPVGTWQVLAPLLLLPQCPTGGHGLRGLQLLPAGCLALCIMGLGSEGTEEQSLWEGSDACPATSLGSAEVPQIGILLHYLFASTVPGRYYSAT